MALNAWMWTMALNAWMWKMSLNAKMWRDDGSESLNVNDGPERQTENMALNVKLEMRLWTPNRKHGSERRNRDVTLNAKSKHGSEHRTEKNEGSEHRNWELTYLNVKLRRTTLNVTLRMTTLNVITKKRWWLWTLNWRKTWWLWMPNWKQTKALNAQNGDALNAKPKKRYDGHECRTRNK